MMQVEIGMTVKWGELNDTHSAVVERITSVAVMSSITLIDCVFRDGHYANLRCDARGIVKIKSQLGRSKHGLGCDVADYVFCDLTTAAGSPATFEF